MLQNALKVSDAVEFASQDQSVAYQGGVIGWVESLQSLNVSFDTIRGLGELDNGLWRKLFEISHAFIEKVHVSLHDMMSFNFSIVPQTDGSMVKSLRILQSETRKTYAYNISKLLERLLM